MKRASLLCGPLMVLLSTGFVSTDESTNTSRSEVHQIIVDGKTRYVTLELLRKLEHERERTHWLPYNNIRLEYINDVAREYVQRDSIESFPDSIFTEDQLRSGGFLLYFLFGVYAFTLLAVICNDYFLPCVELICEDLNIPQNVAAATFMAVATSCPEFFLNVISTFLTESDMGIGTVVGSAIFNGLAVAAIGGFAAITPIALDKRPVTRDVVIYMINVGFLVAFVWDGRVEWYEALIFGILCVLYFIIMFNSVRLFRVYDRTVAKCTKKSNASDLAVVTSIAGVEKGLEGDTVVVKPVSTEKEPQTEKVDPIEADSQKSIFAYPKHKSLLYQVGWLYLLPVKMILSVTVPSPVTNRKWYPLSFIMCIVWIGVNSYFVSWSMTVVGFVFFIPDSVIGLTFLAFGGCLPEAFSIYIMSRRGEGGIGVSNALGANSLDILFALGVPWLFKCLADIIGGAEETAIIINSSGIDFVVGSLLVAVSCLWIVLFIANFMLRKSVGFVLAVLYLIFLTFAILVELEVILDR